MTVQEGLTIKDGCDSAVQEGLTIKGGCDSTGGADH